MKVKYLLISFLCFFLVACATGEQAIQKMSPEEKAFVEKINR